jgi:hypothetical protein
MNPAPEYEYHLPVWSCWHHPLDAHQKANAYRNRNPRILVAKPAENWAAKNVPDRFARLSRGVLSRRVPEEERFQIIQRDRAMHSAAPIHLQVG